MEKSRAQTVRRWPSETDTWRFLRVLIEMAARSQCVPLARLGPADAVNEVMRFVI